jgi:hypothetical protein
MIISRCFYAVFTGTVVYWVEGEGEGSQLSMWRMSWIFIWITYLWFSPKVNCPVLTTSRQQFSFIQLQTKILIYHENVLSSFSFRRGVNGVLFFWDVGWRRMAVVSDVSGKYLSSFYYLWTVWFWQRKEMYLPATELSDSQFTVQCVAFSWNT